MAIIKKFRIKSFKNSKPLISLDKISLSYGNRKILDNVSLKFNQGEICGLLGPNGVGKSTVFNLITGLIKPDYGTISFDGTDGTNYPIYLRTQKFKIGYVPQYGGYFQDLTLIENLKLIAEVLIEDKKKRSIEIDSLIAKFELEPVKEVKAKLLSGGQRRKLVIALALLGKPKILLCDEIMAALDIMTIQMLKEVMINLQTENPHMLIIICEHQARELLSIVDRAMVLSNCKVVAEGTPYNIVNNIDAKSAYFGESFKIN